LAGTGSRSSRQKTAFAPFAMVRVHPAWQRMQWVTAKSEGSIARAMG
jgi:hypothetical protein